MSDSQVVVVAHFWGEKYLTDYVRKLYSGVSRHLKQPHRFIVVTDSPWRFKNDPFERTLLLDPELTKLPGCVSRLRIFDAAWQRSIGIQDGDRIVSMDIDLIVTGSLDTLFDGYPDDFVIVQGINSVNPCPYNGSMFMFKAGTHSDVWSDYTPDKNSKLPFYSFPDDQGWFHHKVPDAGAWTIDSGVYGFKKPGWPLDNNLPANARVVAFPGWRDPGMPIFSGIGWIQKHWRV